LRHNRRPLVGGAIVLLFVTAPYLRVSSGAKICLNDGPDLIALYGAQSMHQSVFMEGEFYALIVSSIIAPVSIYAYLMWRRAIGRGAVLGFGVVMIALSGIDVYVLRYLNQLARVTLSALDDKIFSSEVSTALYVLPVVFAGIGVNIVSHVLIDHLKSAEERYEAETH
jgi:hypothetical protein